MLALSVYRCRCLGRNLELAEGRNVEHPFVRLEHPLRRAKMLEFDRSELVSCAMESTACSGQHCMSCFMLRCLWCWSLLKASFDETSPPNSVVAL